jgi:hypothetical protein
MWGVNESYNGLHIGSRSYTSEHRPGLAMWTSSGAAADDGQLEMV